MIVRDATVCLEAMRRTARAAIEGYNAWSIDKILQWRSDECIHHTLPTTLLQPARDNASYREYWTGTVKPLFRNFKIVVDTEMHDVEQRISSLRAHSTAETPLGPYSNEYVLFLYYNATCDRVVRFEEIVDSGASMAYFLRLRAFVNEQAQGSPSEAWRLYELQSDGASLQRRLASETMQAIDGF